MRRLSWVLAGGAVAWAVGVSGIENNPVFALFLLLLAAGFFVVGLGEARFKRWRAEAPMLFILIAAGAGALVFGLGAYLIGNPKAGLVVDEPGEASAILLKPTALFVDYTPATTPVAIPPHSDLHVLSLSPKAGNEFHVHSNGGSEPMLWPYPLDQKAPLVSFVTRCVVTNHGDTTLLNINMVYDVAYRVPEANGGSHAKDPITAQVKHKVVITALGAGDSFAFLMVNATQMYAWPAYPSTSVVHVFGEQSPREVSLHPAASATALYPFPLAPTKLTMP
jgi:hypothetical protein